MKKVIISGSSRNDGDTSALVKMLVKHSNWDVINLMDYKIDHYDYKHENQQDDFLPLIKGLIDQYDTFIFATPVYWYAMSGVMKVFFDRISDLLTIEKPLGRRLRGKQMAVISTSNGNNLGKSFWLPFQASSEYLGMTYLKDLHTISGELNEEELIQFIQQVDAH
ncbi:flavodoxin family protein [Roseivirga misakiensis]|uniref:FMN reductase n=1 Tax=Roseivirga misakiensis TaxID=1563681 RepID=A0A1E5T2E6_9BACT|nr:NAD(P)H-dependent oxidoreductase [Roseivirga misakiensis]OEK05563.1 FMN reductase [Roseivirga misakiensis]